LLFSRHKILLPKIRWWEVVVSLPVLAFGAILAVGLCISQSARVEFPFWMLLSVLGSTWLVLGASTSLAYFVQWRLRRRLASSTAQQPRLLTSTRGKLGLELNRKESILPVYTVERIERPTAN
jgi:hypothetical protein